MQRNGTPTVSIETITPERAERLLGTNANVRKIRNTDVCVLERAILTHRWTLTNDAITINRAGQLINGQHRLTACVRTQTPIQCLVAHGVEDQVYIDSGRRRGSDVVLAAAGHKGDKGYASAVRLLWYYEGPGLIQLTRPNVRVDHGELLETARRHPGLEESYMKASKAGKVMARSVLAFVHYIGSGYDRDYADLFVEAVAFGEGLTRQQAPYWLRERFLKARAGKLKMHQADILALTIKAWNLWYADTRCLQLRILPNEENVYVFAGRKN